MKAMILAAGRGERMRPLTDTTPKALLPVAGRALLDYPLSRLARAGVVDVVINLAWQGQQIRDFVGDGSRWGLHAAFSDEGPEALETGGGIRQALALLGNEPFWLVNGDVYSEFDFSASPLSDNTLAHLVMVPNPEHNPDGDFALIGTRLRTTGAPRYTYSGIGLIRPELVEAEAPGRFPLAPLLSRAADDSRLTGELYTGLWTDVGTPARLAELERSLGPQTSR